MINILMAAILISGLHKQPGRSLEMEHTNQVDEFCAEYHLAYDDLDHPNSILTREGDRAFISDVEIEAIERIVMAEARGESCECQEAIATVILNRWQSGKFGNSIADVIYAKGQFAAPYTGEVSMSVNLAVKNAIIYYNTYCMCIPDQIFYFRANKYHCFGTPYCTIDNTYFSGSSDMVL